jgi:hypothetical protein
MAQRFFLCAIWWATCAYQFVEGTEKFDSLGAVHWKNETGSGGRKIEAVCSQDNPRWLGKSQVRLVGPAPLKSRRESVGAAEAEFTSSSGDVRTSSNANEELGGEERSETVPNRVK